MSIVSIKVEGIRRLRQHYCIANREFSQIRHHCFASIACFVQQLLILYSLDDMLQLHKLGGVTHPRVVHSVTLNYYTHIMPLFYKLTERNDVNKVVTEIPTMYCSIVFKSK